MDIINRKRFIISSILMISILFFGCNQAEMLSGKTSIEKDSLNGQIKKVKHIYYGEYIAGGRFKKSDHLDKYYILEKKYNKNGMIEKESYYGEKNALFNESTYIYDEKGKLIEENYKYPNAGAVKRLLSYSEDYSDEVSQYIDVDGEVSREIRVRYNEKGKIEKINLIYNEHFFDSTNIEPNSVRQKIEYEYNENMNLLKKVIYDHREKVLHIYKYEYDNNGNKILEIKMNSNRAIEHIIRRGFDKNNNVLK